MSLYGSLLRLSKCLNARVEIVVPDGYQEAWCGVIREWEEALGVGVVRAWPASQWTPQSDCIWRGCVSVVERKVPLLRIDGLLGHFGDLERLERYPDFRALFLIQKCPRRPDFRVSNI